MDLPPAVVAELRAALDLPADARLAPAAGGASGSAWRVETEAGTFVLRRSGSSELTASRIAAMDAARRAGLPVPELVGRAATSFGEVVLLTWLPGVDMLRLLTEHPTRMGASGRRMGELQRRLHALKAPAEVIRVEVAEGRPFGAARGVGGLPSGDRLLHLDWHPLNLLVDPGSGAISGIVDWDNARAGHPCLDLARTRDILTLEPGLATLPPSVRAGLATLLDGWADGYGPEARAIASPCDEWAIRVMLDDLAPRHADRPELLDPLRRRLAELRRSAG